MASSDGSTAQQGSMYVNGSISCSLMLATELPQLTSHICL